METLQINIAGFAYYDLHNPNKLSELTEIFYSELREKNPQLYERFAQYAQLQGEGFTETEKSFLLVEVAPYLSQFIAKIFGIEKEIRNWKNESEKTKIIFYVKKEFFIRRVLKKYSEENSKTLRREELNEQITSLKKYFPQFSTVDDESAMATLIKDLLEHDRAIKQIGRAHV